MIDLITGHQGFNHITAEQVAEINNAMTSGYGVDCVLRLKDGLVTSTGLAVGVGVGYWRANGYDMQMTTAETIYVDPSSVGTSRIDGFYVEILQDIASGNQRSEFVYVKGTEASVPVAPPDPTAPALTTDIMLQCVKFAEALIAENTLTLTDLTKGMEQVTPEDMELVKSWIRDNSDVYSSIVSHKKGEVVLNALDGKIYQCINNCGAFDWETNKSNYTEKTIVEILSDIALGGASGLKYGTCTTAASTTAKTAATANGDFELALGKSVCIRMTYANTASSPTLNVDGTGAKSIKGYGSELPSYWWLAGDMVQFVYDGTYYIMLPTQGELATVKSDLSDISLYAHSIVAYRTWSFTEDVSVGQHYVTNTSSNLIPPTGYELQSVEVGTNMASTVLTGCIAPQNIETNIIYIPYLATANKTGVTFFVRCIFHKSN